MGVSTQKHLYHQSFVFASQNFGPIKALSNNKTFHDLKKALVCVHSLFPTFLQKPNLILNFRGLSELQKDRQLAFCKIYSKVICSLQKDLSDTGWVLLFGST